MDDDSPLPQVARQEAEAWVARLGRASVTNEDLAAFNAWRRIPENGRAWEALQAGRQRVDRYVVRPQAGRYRVVDIWTGETAVIAMTPQDELSEEDARHTAGLLNRRARGGDRSVLQ